jgi:acetyltransferase
VILLSGGFSESAGRARRRCSSAGGKAAHATASACSAPTAWASCGPQLGVNATFAHASALKGSIGLISQSGALCAAILDWAKPNNVGFSTVVSLGSSSDIDFGEVLEYMISDPRTESIFLYVEGIRDARRFMSALRGAARVKPVLLVKAGRHPAPRARSCRTAARRWARTRCSTPRCVAPA